MRHDKWQISHLQCLTDSFRRAGEEWPRAGMSVRCQSSQKNVRQMSDLLHRCKEDDCHQTYGRKISAKSNRCQANISNVKNMSVQYHRCQADASDVRKMSVMSGRYQWFQSDVNYFRYMPVMSGSCLHMSKMTNTCQWCLTYVGSIWFLSERC